MTEQEQNEGTVKVSSKGQIVIPREIRKKMGIKSGEKLLVLICNGDIVLRKTKEMSMNEIVRKIDKVVKEENIDVDKLVAEAIEWAKKNKVELT